MFVFVGVWNLVFLSSCVCYFGSNVVSVVVFFCGGDGDD